MHLAHARLMDEPTFTAFKGHERLAQGRLAVVAAAVAAQPQGTVVVLEDATGRPVDLDLRDGAEAAASEYLARTAIHEDPPRRPGRGRPKLGVIAREVTLLPRHWDWLSRQPGGASAALRRLIEDARRDSVSVEGARDAQEALYRAMSTLAGDLPGFEDASRALFANDDGRLDGVLATWPPDVAAFLAKLAVAARAARGPV